MYSCLLKKLLPFALTFIVGTLVGGLFKSHAGPATWTWAERSTLRLGQEGPFGYGYEHSHSCRMHRRDLVAETKPLVIHLIPHARVPRYSEAYPTSMLVRVTFGADGKVQNVEQLQPLMPDAMQKAAESAARLIYFEPETINGVPVTVTKDIEIPFFTGGKLMGSY